MTAGLYVGGRTGLGRALDVIEATVDVLRADVVILALPRSGSVWLELLLRDADLRATRSHGYRRWPHGTAWQLRLARLWGLPVIGLTRRHDHVLASWAAAGWTSTVPTMADLRLWEARFLPAATYRAYYGTLESDAARICRALGRPAPSRRYTKADVEALFPGHTSLSP